MSVVRRENKTLQERDTLQADVVAAIAATASIALGVMDRDYAVDKFEVEMPGGYTADDANYYAITLQAGAVVLATLSLKTQGGGGFGNLADLVFAQATVAAGAAGSAGDTLKVVFTKNGTAVNVPAGTRIRAKCRLL